MQEHTIATLMDPSVVCQETLISLLPLRFALNEVFIFVTIIDPTHGVSAQQTSSMVLYLFFAVNTLPLVVLSLQTHEALGDTVQVKLEVRSHQQQIQRHLHFY